MRQHYNMYTNKAHFDIVFLCIVMVKAELESRFQFANLTSSSAYPLQD